MATVTFEARDGGTEMTYQGISQDPNQEEVGGWRAIFERLADQLAEGQGRLSGAKYRQSS